jgi:hypothetical protein
MDDTRCCATVRERGSSWPRFSQCQRKWTVEQDGKRWCKQHSPDAKAARHGAREERFKAEMRDISIRNAHRKVAQVAIKHFRQQATFDELEAAVMAYEKLVTP